jgi:hypothetical protein
LKKSAESAVLDAEGRTVKVQATPENIRHGKVSDLSRFELDADQKNKVPYYVTVEYRNNGTRSLLPQMNQKAELRAVSGQSARRFNLIDLSGEGVSAARTRSPTER